MNFKNSKWLNWIHPEILGFIKDLLIVGMVVLFVRGFIGLPFKVSGSSMDSSYYDKGFILVDRLSYVIGKPNRGDVIVFKPGVNHNKEYFLKRIIGVPGDSVKIENGFVYVQPRGASEFTKLNESYLNPHNNGSTFAGIQKNAQYKLGTDQYFVMGDNRQGSTDSRHCFGKCGLRSEFISHADMTGKVFMDLGYFDIFNFRFLHPQFGFDTTPRFFSSPASFDYNLET